MKKHVPLLVLCVIVLTIGIMHSCKKDTASNITTTVYIPPITYDYTEEFEQVSALTMKGWLFGEYSEGDTLGVTNWTQGMFGPSGKGDTTWYGFTAYSFSSLPDEYIYSFDPAVDSGQSISSWMLTPVLTVKSGDKISFYTRGDTSGTFTNRMQVLLSKTASIFIGHDLNSIGDYTVTLFDINATQTSGGYPTIWTKYEYTFTDFPVETNIRLAFRHFVLNPSNARGIGVDQFKFETN